MTDTAPRILVDLDDRTVCARPQPSAAAASPPVVLLAGGAGQGTEGAWGPDLEALLGREAPVLAYDRAGSGRSDGPLHGTLAGMAEDLHRLLEVVDVTPPVVLVGWSLGGLLAQAHALRHPEDVAGMVLVDPTPSEPPPRSAAVRTQLAVVKVLLQVSVLAARAGVFSGRLGERVATRLAGPEAGSTTRAISLRLMRDPAALRALAGTMALQPRYAAEIEDALARTPLPDVPAVVISAARRAGVPAEYVTSIADSHRRLAARFGRGRLVVAERASHQVPYDDPGVIADAVRAVAG